MLQAKIIEEAANPWASNLVVVPRPGNPVPRITVDYRKLNAITYRDRFPLPRISDCLDAMSGSACFSALDLSCSFNQVPIDPRDRDKTAFLTRRGQFRFQVMPQGAVNCLSVFSRLSQMVLRGLSPTCYAVYIDDTVVLGQSFEQAAANLELVLDRFR